MPIDLSRGKQELHGWVTLSRRGLSKLQETFCLDSLSFVIVSSQAGLVWTVSLGCSWQASSAQYVFGSSDLEAVVLTAPGS